MKNTQVIQLMSIVWLSIFMLGITMMSCSSKKEQQLPAIGKSVALFDYFSYKGNDDFYISNPLSGEDYFYNPILPSDKHAREKVPLARVKSASGRPNR